MMKYLLFFCSLFFCSCFSNRQSLDIDRGGLIVNLDSIEVEENMYMSSLFNGVKAVILDNSEVVLDDIVRLQVHKELIYILDQTNHIYAFDKKGKFVQGIGAIGDGPGEYLDPSDFAIDPVGDYLYVLDFSAQSILQYNILTGRFLRTIKLDNEAYRSRYIQLFDDQLYTDLHAKGKEGNYLLRRVNLNSGKTEQCYLDKDNDNKKWGQIQGNSPFYTSSNGHSYFIPIFSDAIFQLSDQGIDCALTLKSHNMMDEQTVSTVNVNDGATFNNLIASGKIYNVTPYIEYGNKKMFMYSEGHATRLILGETKGELFRKANSLFDDLVFENKSGAVLSPRFCFTDSDGVYSYISQYDIDYFLEIARNGQLNAKLDQRDKLMQLGSDCNPIVLIYEY